MEIDQLEKQVEWLDKERREEKKIITGLQKKITQLEEMLEKAKSSAKDLDSEITQMKAGSFRLEKYDEALDALRTEVKKELDAFEKRMKQREGDVKKRQSQEFSDMVKAVSEFQAKFNAMSNLREELISRKEDEDRRTQLIAELKDKVDNVDFSEKGRRETFSALEEDRRTDKKRLADLQAEVNSLRKRTDEHKGKLDLFSDWQKRGDARMNEILANEDERRDANKAFMEKMSQAWADREKLWKEWNRKFEMIDVTSDSFSQSMISIHEAELAIRQAQEEFNQITEQLNRRIHEITEMQRLGEERFRQEWATFKSDDQKRWTNYALTQDEQQKELRRRVENFIERVTSLEETSQDLQDAVQLMSEQTGKLMQGLMSGLRDWLAESERFGSSVR
jgi:DNA repair exonuclease SbcCD ATPase subunit